MEIKPVLPGLLALLLALPAAASVPETPRFRAVGVAEGLPSTDILGLARDRTGYLWIATADGLARYDGSGTRVWRHDPDDPDSLGESFVQAVHVDGRDRVWVATGEFGISMLDRDSGGFRHYRKATDPRIDSDNVFSLTHRGDEIWFGTYEGSLHRLSPDGAITVFAHDPDDPASLPPGLVFALAADDAGRLWIGSFGGLAKFEDGKIQRIALPGGQPAPRIFSITVIGPELWIGTAAGVFVGDGDGDWRQPPWSSMFEHPNAVMAIARDVDGGLWIASQRSLWRGLPGQAPRPVALGSAMKQQVLHALVLQDDGALWVPMPGIGLGYLRSDWRQVAQFRGEENGLSDDIYRAVAAAGDGGVWLGGHNGALNWLGVDGTVERFEQAIDDALAGRRIYAAAEDRIGNLWLGLSNGLLRITGAGAVDGWRADDARAPTLPGWTDHLRIAPDGSVWASMQGAGVQQRDPASGAVLTNIPARPETGLNTGDIEDLAIAPDGGVWVAGHEGLSRLDPERAVFTLVEATRGGRVFALAFESADALWLQRMEGLARYQRDDDGWRLTARVGAAEGVPAIGASALRVDGRGRVWLSTLRGLYRWDPQARTLRHYGVQNGFSSQEFVDRALALSERDMLVAAAADGSVIMIDTEAPDPSPSSPTLDFDAFEVRREGRWQAVAQSDRIELASDQREFRIKTRLLAYDDPLANRYWSKLDGIDSDWVSQGASGERVFAGLPAGDYLLHLRGLAAGGALAPGRQLRILVHPPWWKTPWALALFVAASLLLAWWAAAAYRTRLRRRNAWQLVQHKRELAEQASEAKTRFLATLGHEVRTPMTGVLGMSELLLETALDGRQRGYTESIRRAGEHLMRLVNDALDLARIEAGKLQLDPQPFDLRGLLDDVSGLMAPLARQRGLDYREQVVRGVPQWVRGDAGRVRQILLNLLGNAIKFTEQGQVGLRVEPGEGLVRFVVSDTGPGLNAEQKQRLFRRFEQAEGARTAARYGGSGLGLAICQELAAAMEGRIEVDSAPGEGTRFTVALPLPPVTAVPGTSHAQASRTTTGRRLLLVEDDPTVAEVIADLLRMHDHRVTAVAHGLAALTEVARDDFDLALLDLDLPGIDGLALARQLRAQGFERPLVAVTARADAEAEPLARAAGFDAFLRKPVTGTMLATAIEVALDQRDAPVSAA
ncbi:sensor histidine kinase [Luteimonas salinilitoris]|uniref:histidine kinase n=1 Tax=Luteimonas salinilitoris TaxID=3237697 RepID=A0ABV4HUF0_9GAMM